MAVGEAWASGGTVKIRILAVNPAAPPFFRFVAVLFRSRWKAAIASAAMGCGARPSRKSEHVAGWSSPVAREAHNLEVTGSNPVPAISRPPGHPWPRRAVFCAASYRVHARRAIHGAGGLFFARLPAAFTPARPSMAPAGCFFARRRTAYTPAGPSAAPVGCFLRGVVPRGRFVKRRKFRRTRGNPSGCRGFCRFVRGRAVPRGRLLRRQMRCKCAAICVARRRPPGERFRARGRGRCAAAHDVLEVVLAGHQIVLGRDLRRVPEPRGDDVGRVLLHPVGLSEARRFCRSRGHRTTDRLCCP